eukprot:3887996-Pyramimonas_sp.AAC.1
MSFVRLLWSLGIVCAKVSASSSGTTTPISSAAKWRSQRLADSVCAEAVVPSSSSTIGNARVLTLLADPIPMARSLAKT